VLAAVAARIAADDPLSAVELRQVPEPAPPEGWEVLQVRAAALNHHDLWTLQGVGVTEDDLPVVLGTDVAGVTADGRPVLAHAVLSAAGPGEDETLSPDLHMLTERGIPGGLAEHVAVPSRNLVPKPALLSYAEAACLPTAYLTAYRMLFTRAGLRPGDRVLVQGAGGGVATAAVVVGRAAGLAVYVTSRSPEKRARAMELGATLAIETGGRLPERVDAVIETVGRATWGHSLRALRPGGTVVVSGATTGSDPPAELNRLFWRGLTVMGSSMGTLAELRRLCAFCESAGVRPVVDSEWPLEQAPAALAKLHAGEEFGKIVVTLPERPGSGEAMAWAEEALALAPSMAPVSGSAYRDR
jgi:NADPH:quinone reductase-like Zn-dependent oxidoreductase